MTMDVGARQDNWGEARSLHLAYLDEAGTKVWQQSKNQEIRTALLRGGALTLDKPAQVLGLSRGTTRSITTKGIAGVAGCER